MAKAKPKDVGMANAAVPIMFWKIRTPAHLWDCLPVLSLLGKILLAKLQTDVRGVEIMYVEAWENQLVKEKS